MTHQLTVYGLSNTNTGASKGGEAFQERGSLEGAGWPTPKLRSPGSLGRRRYGAALGPALAGTAGPCRGWPPAGAGSAGCGGEGAFARRDDNSAPARPPRSRPARFPLAPSPALSLPRPPLAFPAPNSGVCRRRAGAVLLQRL